MDPQRLVRAGTPAEVSVLGVMALILGAGCLAAAAFPMAQDAPRGVLVALGLVAVTVALALVLAGGRVSPVYLHITVVLFTPWATPGPPSTLRSSSARTRRGATPRS